MPAVLIPSSAPAIDVAGREDASRHEDRGEGQDGATQTRQHADGQGGAHHEHQPSHRKGDAPIRSTSR